MVTHVRNRARERICHKGQTLDFQSTGLPTELPSRDRRRSCVASWGFHYAAMWLQGNPEGFRGCPIRIEQPLTLRLQIIWHWSFRFIVPARFAVTIGHMKNSVFTGEAPAAIGPYSQAVRSGNFLFCSG